MTMKIVIALSTWLSAMVRRKTLTVYFPRIRFHRNISSTTKVTVFRPPAVDPEEPPISIRKMDTPLPAGVSSPWSTPANPAVRSVMDWKKDARSFWGTVIIPSLIVFALSFLAVGLGRSLGMMLLGAVLGALGYGALNPIIQTLCIRTVPPERRGVASNTQYFGMDLGYFLGPLLGGLLYSAFGRYSAMYLAGGIVPLVLALVLFLLIWGKLKQRLY